MKILPGLRAEDFKEAACLAFSEAGVGDMAGSVADVLSSLVEEKELRGDAEKSINVALRSKYRSKLDWWGEQWFYVPVPVLRFDAREIPRLIIEVTPYLVAPVKIGTSGNLRFVTLVGPVSKPKTLTVPVVFLQAVLDDDLARFNILGRCASHTIWDIPGTRSVELPNNFVDKLIATFKRQSVVTWLSEFGLQGRSVAPLVAGSLLGLQHQGAASQMPMAKQTCTNEMLVNDLQGMSYSIKEAREMVNQAAPYLRPEQTEEEALRIVLQQAGKGG